MKIQKDFKVDFIGVGAPRSGTTWVSKCLEEHPEIGFSYIKETNFFLDNNKFNQGLDYYKSFFPSKKKIVGEFSVQYLRNPKAAERIKNFFPNTKIIINIRNPVDMIYSLYWHVKGNNKETSSTFEKALARDDFYKKQGLYYPKIKKYYQLFPPRQIHIIEFQNIKTEPKKVVNELFSFLEVDNEFTPSILEKKVNTSRRFRSNLLSKIGVLTEIFHQNGIHFAFLKKIGFHQKLLTIYELINKKDIKYQAMKKETRQKLIKYYRKDIKKLEQLINRDLSYWLK